MPFFPLPSRPLTIFSMESSSLGLATLPAVPPDLGDDGGETVDPGLSADELEVLFPTAFGTTESNAEPPEDPAEMVGLVAPTAVVLAPSVGEEGEVEE